MKQKWARYHLIKDMLQDERAPSVTVDFSDSDDGKTRIRTHDFVAFNV